MSAGFPVVPAHQIAGEATSPRWLVEGLWGKEAVGIIGGEPKCGKTFLALGLAVAVASGRPCLGRFPVHTTGRVLLFAAEDAPVIAAKSPRADLRSLRARSLPARSVGARHPHAAPGLPRGL